MAGSCVVTHGSPQLEFMNKGKRQIIQLLNRNVVAKVTMMKVIQIACYIASVILLAWSFWNLTHSDLTAMQIVRGLLVSVLGPLVFLGIAVLLPLLSAGESTE